jgi:hypothetical protein
VIADHRIDLDVVVAGDGTLEVSLDQGVGDVLPGDIGPLTSSRQPMACVPTWDESVGDVVCLDQGRPAGVRRWRGVGGGDHLPGEGVGRGRGSGRRR